MIRQKNPYPPKAQEVKPVVSVPNKAVANYPMNDPKSGISRMIELKKAEKMQKKVETIAMGVSLGNC